MINKKFKVGDYITFDGSRIIDSGTTVIISEREYRQITGDKKDFRKDTIFVYDGEEAETMTIKDMRDLYVRTSYKKALKNLESLINEFRGQLKFLKSRKH